MPLNFRIAFLFIFVSALLAAVVSADMALPMIPVVNKVGNIGNFSNYVLVAAPTQNFTVQPWGSNIANQLASECPVSMIGQNGIIMFGRCTVIGYYNGAGDIANIGIYAIPKQRFNSTLMASLTEDYLSTMSGNALVSYLNQNATELANNLSFYPSVSNPELKNITYIYNLKFGSVVTTPVTVNGILAQRNTNQPSTDWLYIVVAIVAIILIAVILKRRKR